MSVIVQDNGEIRCDGGTGIFGRCDFEMLYEPNAQCGNCPLVSIHKMMMEVDMEYDGC